MGRTVDAHPSFAPTIGEFKKLCKAARGEPVVRPLPALPDKTDREVAKQTCAIMFARRLTGLKMIGVSADAYEGQFDAATFVLNQAVPLNPDLKLHRQCWEDMWNNFDRAYA